MPSLYVFHRKTIFAGDDLQPTAFITAITRAIQFFLLLIPILYYITRDLRLFVQYYNQTAGIEEDKKSHIFDFVFGGDLYPNECNQDTHYFPLFIYLYVIFSCAHAFVSTIFEYKITNISNIGSPTQPELRLLLPHLVQRKWIWVSILGNLVLFSLGSFPFFTYRKEYFACHNIVTGNDNDDDEYINMGFFSKVFGRHAWIVMFVILLISQGIELVVSSFALISFLQKRKVVLTEQGYARDSTQSDAFMSYHHHHHHALAEEMWDNRCQKFCRCAAFSTCYLFGGREIVDGVAGDYGQIARALADYFEDGGVLDLAPSDLAAGLGMLQRVQRQRVLEARRNVLREVKERSSTGDLNTDLRHNGSGGASSWRPIGDISLYDQSFWNSSVPDLEVPIIDMTSSLLKPIMPFTNTLLVDSTMQENDFDGRIASSGALTLKMKSDDEQKDSRHWYEAVDRKVFNDNEAADRQVLAEGARFARHALSIYTWLLYVYMKPATCFPRLFFDRISECFKRRQQSPFHSLDEQSETSLCFNVSHGNTVGDNFFHLHRNSLMLHSGLDDSDLVYANFNNAYNQMPYAIVVDHKWQSIVVTIRGTLSLEDCVVDTLIDPEPLQAIGEQYGFDASDQYCHGGALACAKWVIKDLERHRLIESLLSDMNAEYRHYNLRLTGHSIGAACATLLGFMLRQRYPTLRVIAISPPGYFLTRKLATECNGFVTSFVLDSDLVPRLTVSSMEHLRNEVLDIIGRIKVPKSNVMKNFIINSIIKASLDDQMDPDELSKMNSEILLPKSDAPSDSEFYRRRIRFQDIQSARKEQRGEYRNIELYPPGKIIHLVKTGEQASCIQSCIKCITCFTSNAGYTYTPVWANNDDFNEITVSPTMAFDHFPNRVCLEIEKVARSFGIDTSMGSTEQDRMEGEGLRHMRHLF